MALLLLLTPICFPRLIDVFLLRGVIYCFIVTTASIYCGTAIGQCGFGKIYLAGAIGCIGVGFLINYVIWGDFYAVAFGFSLMSVVLILAFACTVIWICRKKERGKFTH